MKLDKWEIEVIENQLNEIWKRNSPQDRAAFHKIMTDVIQRGYRYQPPSFIFGGGWLVDEDAQ